MAAFVLKAARNHIGQPTLNKGGTGVRQGIGLKVPNGCFVDELIITTGLTLVEQRLKPISMVTNHGIVMKYCQHWRFHRIFHYKILPAPLLWLV